jgi:hypothetical protein
MSDQPGPDPRAKWALGIDEADPCYSFIGVVGGTACWVESEDCDETVLRRIVEAHNATIDAWETEREKEKERRASEIRVGIVRLKYIEDLEADNAAIKARVEALEKAVKPLAKTPCLENFEDDEILSPPLITAGDVRFARAALAAGEVHDGTG